MMIMNNDNDHVPDGVAADDDDHDVDAHSGDQNLALSDQFLQESNRLWMYEPCNFQIACSIEVMF